MQAFLHLLRLRVFRPRVIGMASAAALVTLVMAGIEPAQASPGQYLTRSQFLQQVFGEAPIDSSSFIVDSELREQIEDVLNHRFDRLRVRYWRDGDTTAWVLDEIGKTEPITIGVAVEHGRVHSVRVLEFRESRGWEVRYPFFTDQFRGAGLDSDTTIDRSIDGITGATLSVTAVDKIVRLALIFDERVRAEHAEPAGPS